MRSRPFIKLYRRQQFVFFRTFFNHDHHPLVSALCQKHGHNTSAEYKGNLPLHAGARPDDYFCRIMPTPQLLLLLYQGCSVIRRQQSTMVSGWDTQLTDRDFCLCLLTSHRTCIIDRLFIRPRMNWPLSGTLNLDGLLDPIPTAFAVGTSEQNLSAETLMYIHFWGTQSLKIQFF